MAFTSAATCRSLARCVIQRTINPSTQALRTIAAHPPAWAVAAARPRTCVNVWSRQFSAAAQRFPEQTSTDAQTPNQTDSGTRRPEGAAVDASSTATHAPAHAGASEVTGAGGAIGDIPGAQHGTEKMIMMYTCKVCETRSARVITKVAYYQGVVLVRCPGCTNLHLVADHLGYFEDGHMNIESLLSSKGESVRRIAVATSEGGIARDAAGAYHDRHVVDLTPHDIAVLHSASKSVNLKTGEEVKTRESPTAPSVAPATANNASEPAK